MATKHMVMLALICLASACKKDDDKESNTASAKLENGFYLDGTSCQSDQNIVGTYISGDNVGYAFLYVTKEACDAASIADVDVLAYSVEPAGTWAEFLTEVSSAGYTVSVESGAISIVENASGKKQIRKKFLGPQDRNKEVTLSVTDLKIEKQDDLRNISLQVRVNGPELSYEPSMWCDSSVEEGTSSRLSQVEFQGTSPTFALQAVVNDPSDSDQYVFPAKCQVSIGIYVPSEEITGGRTLIDIAFGNKISVE